MASDDLHCYRAIQEGLAASANPWVSLHRDHKPSERDSVVGRYNGTSEISMRGQFRAWLAAMTHVEGET